MVIYDTTAKCVRVYQGDPMAWSDCPDSNGTLRSSLACSSATFSPATATAGTTYSGMLTISYTGGNGDAYAAQSLTSSPAGFTVALPAGNFANGAGSATYNVTAATVPVAGSYTFNITLAGKTYTKIITVNN